MQKTTNYAAGLVLATLVALLARQLVTLPGLSVLGTMVTAILFGIIVRTTAEKIVLPGQAGVGFTAKYILRAGIILTGIRLNISDILAAGWQTIALDILVILFAITVITILGRRLDIEEKLVTLVAVGTGVCGAAAIGAVAPLIRAKNEDVAISVTIIATLGTLFTIIYTATLPVLAMNPHEFGIFAGSTLHELAHVIAAAAPAGPESSDTAILVKLGRVAFLAPVAMVFGWLYSKNDRQNLSLSKLPIPWFILGFLVMAVLNTYHIFSAYAVHFLINGSMFLLTMAMGAMGLNVRLSDFKRVGHKPVIICLCGSILLSLFGRLLIWALNI